MTAATITELIDERLERLRSGARDAGLDAFLATSDESIAYLSGFRPLQLERLFAVVTPVSGGGSIVVPRLDLGQVTGGSSVLEPVSYEASSDGLSELAGALGDAQRVGVEEDHLVYGRAEALRAHGLELVAAGSVVGSLRGRKDEAEIAKVRDASDLVERALVHMFEALQPGSIERTVNAKVESWLREQGASDAHPLILFGENAANPHGEPGPRELRRGDVVCADVSACLDGYWGDLTRCATAGAPSAWAREAWEVVREAQAVAIDACRVGVPAREADAAQRRVIESRPDLGSCLHGAGHSIGLAVHEPPFLVPRTETPLEAGMIFTIEPGIYQEGIGGIRLEDDVVVRADGPEMLSSLSLDLVELGS